MTDDVEQKVIRGTVKSIKAVLAAKPDGFVKDAALALIEGWDKWPDLTLVERVEVLTAHEDASDGDSPIEAYSVRGKREGSEEYAIRADFPANKSLAPDINIMFIAVFLMQDAIKDDDEDNYAMGLGLFEVATHRVANDNTYADYHDEVNYIRDLLNILSPVEVEKFVPLTPNDDAESLR